MEHILELEDTDDVTSIRSRIEFAFPPPPIQQTRAIGNLERGRLLLIVPRKNQALQSLVNMKLLARTVKTKSVELAIVSGHPTVRDYAKEAGVKAFGSLGSAKRAGWVTSKAPVASPDETMPPVMTSPEEEEQTAPERASNQPTKQRKSTRKQAKARKKYAVVEGSGRVGILQQFGALLLLVMLALALVFGAVALLPQATVTLTPVAETVEANLVVNADPEADNIDYETLTFPARTAQVELALFDEIQTVETELAPVGKAEGEVTFINRTEDEQTIPMSTTLSTSAGAQIDFLTVQTTTLPAGIGATTSTLVIAVEPGPSGNVTAGQINRFVDSSYALLARLVNEQPLSGGTMEPAKVVVQADKERLQAYLRQRIQQEGLDRLQQSLGEQEFIPPETVQVIPLDVSYKEFAGDFSDTFGGEMQAVVRGTVVGGYNANLLALAALEAQVPSGFELDTEGLYFGAGEVLNVQNGIVTFRVIANGRIIPVIDAHSVAREIAWLPIGEAQARLSQRYKLAATPGVELKPDWLVEWLGRLPYMSLRIDVVINDAVTLMANGG